MPPHRAFDVWTVLATCGGLGLAPVAPGTFGTLAGIPLSLATGATATWLAGLIGTAGPGATAVIEALLLVPVVAAGVPICTRAAATLGLGKDPGAIVLDEAVALPLVLLVVPPAARTPAMLAAAFVLFRLFDITKPFPCRRLEALPAGLGIMADDQAAAIWAAACLALLRWLVAVVPPGG
jgi:phosphatidylglycerophosphatase A